VAEHGRHAEPVTELITPRLELRRGKETDLDQYAPIVADPEVNRHLGGPKTEPQPGVRSPS
jgi:RimJ/RimL family protein N-acetyltransferase